jgi:hypothetical protein
VAGSGTTSARTVVPIMLQVDTGFALTKRSASTAIMSTCTTALSASTLRATGSGSCRSRSNAGSGLYLWLKCALTGSFRPIHFPQGRTLNRNATLNRGDVATRTTAVPSRNENIVLGSGTVRTAMLVAT